MMQVAMMAGIPLMNGGAAGGLNHSYGYVGNNPVSYTDPYGLWSLEFSWYSGAGGGVTFYGDGKNFSFDSMNAASFQFGFGKGSSGFGGTFLPCAQAPDAKRTKPGNTSFGAYFNGSACRGPLCAVFSWDGGFSSDIGSGKGPRPYNDSFKGYSAGSWSPNKGNFNPAYGGKGGFHANASAGFKGTIHF